jgi:Na+/H+-dicarboxylate symporter
MKLTTPTSRALLALIAGLLVGILLDATGSPLLRPIASLIEPLGTIWVNAIRMTVIPLVVSLVIVGVAGLAHRQNLGQLGLRTFAVFVIVLAATAALMAVLAPLAMRPLQIDAQAVAELRASASTVTSTTAMTSLKEWLLSIVPTNPVRAAVDGAMLPLFVFTLTFAFALRRVSDSYKQPLLAALEAVKEASTIIVRWILLLAPIGVFALALGLGARLGAAVVGAIGYYVLVMVALHVVAGMLMYLLARVSGRVKLRTFAIATAPAQIVALSSRSSMAALPTMFQGAEKMAVRPEVAGFVLPLAISSFRLSSPVNWPVGALFVAALYGIQLDAAALATIAVASVVLNPAAPAVPSGGLFVQAPVYMAVGLPVEGLGILIAIDAIPDIFKTLLNVTADMSVATVLSREASWT